MRKNQGFTLMEILAVVLVIAVVASMAVPMFRTVRQEMRNSQAKAATKQLAEAVRTYYQVSRGRGITAACFIPDTMKSLSTTDCVSPAATGIPGKGQKQGADVKQLFACGYVNYKDFASLPYTFCTCNGAAGNCNVATGNGNPFAVAMGRSGAGKKYEASNYRIYVDQGMKVGDTEK